MNKIQWPDLKNDFLGGLNAGIIALPLAMALGVESGLGAGAGLISGIVVCFIASLTGGTPWLISGPTGSLTVISSVVIARELERADSQASGLTTIFVIFLLAGVFTFFFGLLRVGRYASFVPYPVVSGFRNGVGILMILFQVMPLIGHPMEIHIGNLLAELPSTMQQINVAALVLAVSTIVLVYGLPLLTRAVPAMLVALVIVSVGAYVFHANVPLIGDINGEWIRWRWSHLVNFSGTEWKDVLEPAFTLSLVGMIDTLLTMMVINMFAQDNLKNDQQLIGQGLGNIAGALAGGLPASGATVRTVSNVRFGGKTWISALVHSLLLLLVLLEVGGVIHFIPLSVLAGLLITVGISIIDYKSFTDLFKVERTDALIMIVVMVMTVTVGLLEAFATGIVLASLFFVKKMADKSATLSEPILLIPENEGSAGGLNPVYLAREIYVQEFTGPLFFGFAANFRKAFALLTHTRAVIFRMERVSFIDQSGYYALRESLAQLRHQKIVIVITGLPAEMQTEFVEKGIVPQLVENRWVISSFAAAADELVKYLEENPVSRINTKVHSQVVNRDDLKNRMN